MELEPISANAENHELPKTWTADYRGFESILDFDEYWMDYLREIVPSGQYKGTVRITMEYIPDDEVLTHL